jgi:uncharacterized protein YndB with AHSA1/START domain
MDAYGVLTEPATLTITRVLPGPIERVWEYLTQGELRRKWLASGQMESRVGASVELVWRNDELSDPPGERPPGFPEDHRMVCEIQEFEPPRKLTISWGSTGGVSIELEPKGDEVLLTLVHRRVPDRSILLNVSAGWHAHLDILVARLRSDDPEPFWNSWLQLKRDYDERLPK